jgi:gliding motility-associated-like protein
LPAGKSLRIADLNLAYRFMIKRTTISFSSVLRPFSSQKRFGEKRALCACSLAFLGIFLLSLFSTTTASAQLTLNAGATPQQLVQTIVGAGYNISNIKINCPTGAIGQFTNVSSNIGLSNGILLTTGGIGIAQGPNNSVSAGINNGAPGDFDLSNLSGAATFDGCSLEFDLIPTCDTLKIKYVFGSEEYPEYVNKQFNDVFAFYISGPGYVGKQNIALVPGTTLPVSINNVNSGMNPQYYIDNTNGASIQYDGFTTPMFAIAKVTPCSVYHLKLVIADVVDGIFDSGVFIQGSTIECAAVAYNDIASNTNAVKSCADGSFSFCRTGDTTKPFTIKYNVGGTAISGVDYVALTDSVVIPANQRCMSTNLVTLQNPGSTGTKTVNITYQFGFCPKLDTITLLIKEPLPIDAGPDLKFCSGDTVSMGKLPAAGCTYSWQPVTGLSNPNIANPKITLANLGPANKVIKYVLSETNPLVGSCLLKDSLQVIVKALPKAQFNSPASSCVGASVTFSDNSIPGTGNTVTAWYWDFGNSLFDNMQKPVIKYTTPGTYTVALTATDNTGCKNDTSSVITIWPLPVAAFTLTSACQGDSVRFLNGSTVPGGGAIQQSVWSFGDGTPLTGTTSPSHLYPNTANTYTVQLIISSTNNCIGTSQEVVHLNPVPTASFSTSPASICMYDMVKYANQSTGSINSWTFGDGTTSGIRNPFHQFAAPGVYQVQLITTTNFGCADTLVKSVTIHDTPKIGFFATDTAGCPSFCTKFLSQVFAGSDSVTAWTWLFNSGDAANGSSAQYCYQRNGKYSPMLIATSKYGCLDTVTRPFYIHVYPRPKASFAISPGIVSTFQPGIQISNTSSPDVTNWWWDFGDAKTDSGAGPFVHTYSISGDEYTILLNVKNNFGCTDTTSLHISVRPESEVYIANAFTPNADGKNEIFRPYCSGVYEYADFEMDIYDRWGAQLLKTHDLSKGWDGTYMGNACQQDVYVYDVFFTNKTDGSFLYKTRGRVTLIR